MEEVNRWLSGERRLGTGYRLERVEFKRYPSRASFISYLNAASMRTISANCRSYTDLKVRTEIALRDFRRHSRGPWGCRRRHFADGARRCELCERDGILAIEQPELHIHPAIQVGMGDLFIHAIQANPEGFPTVGKTLLVETHSEHILLRLLRRIRERTDDELAPGFVGLKPRICRSFMSK